MAARSNEDNAPVAPGPGVPSAPATASRKWPFGSHLADDDDGAGDREEGCSRCGALQRENDDMKKELEELILLLAMLCRRLADRHVPSVVEGWEMAARSNDDNAPVAPGVPSATATASGKWPFGSLLADDDDGAAGDREEGCSRCGALQRENDDLKKELEELASRVRELEDQNKDLQLQLEYRDWRYAAEGIPSLWKLNHSVEYVEAMRDVIDKMKDATDLLRRGEKIKHICLGGLEEEVQLCHDVILLPHWQELVDALAQYTKFSHRKDHGIGIFSIGCIDLHSSVLEMLLPVLKVIPMKCFGLARNRFQGDEGVSFMADVARSNSNLAEIAWGFNQLESADDLRRLISSIISNPSGLEKEVVIHQSFSGNRPEMLQAILTPCQDGLPTLSLAENGIESQGVHAIAHFLAVNPPLESLSLLGNRLIDGDGEVLANALRINSHLRSLELDGNEITEVGRNKLLQAVFDASSLNSCAASNHTCSVHGLTPDISDINRFWASRAMKIFTVLASSDQGFFDVSCLGSVSYKLIPAVLRLAQEFGTAPALLDAYEEQTGKRSADWAELEGTDVALTSVFELLRSWAVPAICS